MNSQFLQQIGLSEGESKVYLALLTLGATKTGSLAKEAGVSSSKVYKILDRLEKKGLVGHVIKAKTKHFKAMEPRRVLDFLDNKEQELQEQKMIAKQFLPQLEQQQKQSQQKTEATLYEGFKAISNFFRNILDELKSGEEYFVMGAYYGVDAPGIRSFFYNFHAERAKKKIKVNMLANFETKGNLVETTKICSEIRYLPQYFVSNMSIVFYKRKAFIFFLTKDPRAFLLESDEVVQSFKTYFNTLWKIA